MSSSTQHRPTTKAMQSRFLSVDSDTTLVQTSRKDSQSPKESTMSRPSINWSLWSHKTGIITTWSILFVSSLILPLVLFYTLKYTTDVSITTILSIATAIFGAPTLYSLVMRTWNLLRKDSKCRPIGSRSLLELDFFHWDFLFGLVIVTVIIVVGNVIVSVRVSALGLPVLITEVGVQILVGGVLAAKKASSPIAISSVRRGQQVRGGTYAITEDIIAVDSDGGSRFRQELSDRWEASPEIRNLFVKMDFAWGTATTVAGAFSIGLLFGLENEDAAWAVGWVLPWSLAIIGGIGTLCICRKTLGNEMLQTPIGFGHV